MGMLVNYTDFTGLLDVGLSPDTGADSVTKDAERELLESYIGVYEPEYLLRVLGEDVYAEFARYLSDGHSGKVEKWERLKALLTGGCNPVACYVYVHYTGLCGRSVTRSGVVKSSADGDLVSPSLLQIRAWNLMARQNRLVFELLGGGDYEGAVFDGYMMETVNELGI